MPARVISATLANVLVNRRGAADEPLNFGAGWLPVNVDFPWRRNLGRRGPAPVDFAIGLANWFSGI